MAKVGRPTKYRPEFCEDVIRLGREGYSKASMAWELDIDIATMWRWEKEHPEFHKAMKRARALARGWWEEQGRLGTWSTKDRQLNAAAYSLQMRNRFPKHWRDKQEHDLRTPDGITVRRAEAREHVTSEIERIAQRRAEASVPSENGKH